MTIRLRLLLRQLAAQPLQSLLSMIAIALAVAVVLSIDLVNASAVRSFERSRQSLLSEFTHQITGNMAVLPESFYTHLRVDLGVRNAFPVVEGTLALADSNALRILGTDPVTLLDGRDENEPLAAGIPAARLMQGLQAVVTQATARRLALVPPQSITVVTRDGTRDIQVIAAIPPRNALLDDALEDTFWMDIASAQELLSMTGRLSRIDLRLSAVDATRIARALPSNLSLTRRDRRSDAMEQMTRAFRLNLTALSLLALLIGAFLIYNSMTLSVLRRRGLIATVRTLGLTRRELAASVIAEALLLACAGIVAGTLLGIGLAGHLLELASRTIDDLYYAEEITRLHFEPSSFLRAYALALLCTLLAALYPALEASRIPPELGRSRSRLESRTIARQSSLVVAGICLALLGAAVIGFSGHSIVAGFAALFLIVLAGALLIPACSRLLLAGLLAPLRGLFGMTGALACRGLAASMSRTQVAITALAIAISATVAVSVMIASFRDSVVTWLGSYLRADLYVTQVDARSGSGLPDELATAIRADPDVRTIHTISWRNLIEDDLTADLYAIGIEEHQFDNYRFLDRIAGPLWPRFCCSDSVIVSEPYAFRHGTRIGGHIALTTPKGKQEFEVIGIYRDYLSDGGIVTTHRATYERWWQDDRILSLAVYLREGAPPDGAVARLERAFPGFRVRATATLRAAALQIFDRTFAITEMLRVLAVVIAIVGVLGALTAIEAERGEDFILLRVTGVTRRGLHRLILTESGVMGLLSGALAVPLGILMAFIIIEVINRRSFGWSMDMLLDARYGALAVALGVGSGMLAGIYPAWSIARVPPIPRMRHE